MQNLKTCCMRCFFHLTLTDEGTSHCQLACNALAGGQTYLLSNASAQESLAHLLLLLYGQVEHAG